MCRPAAGDQPHPGDRQAAGVSAETPSAGQPVVATSSGLADALVVAAEAFLAGKVAWERQAQREQAEQPEPFRTRKWVTELSDSIEYIRQLRRQHTAA